MNFSINGTEWLLEFVNPSSRHLYRSDGSITIGVTDNTLKTVFINNRLSDHMLDKVLCHELVHVFSFENDCDIDIETEELIADFMSLYGRSIIYLADNLLKSLFRKIS